MRYEELAVLVAVQLIVVDDVVISMELPLAHAAHKLIWMVKLFVALHEITDDKLLTDVANPLFHVWEAPPAVDTLAKYHVLAFDKRSGAVSAGEAVRVDADIGFLDRNFLFAAVKRHVADCAVSLFWLFDA